MSVLRVLFSSLLVITAAACAAGAEDGADDSAEALSGTGGTCVATRTSVTVRGQTMGWQRRCDGDEPSHEIRYTNKELPPDCVAVLDTRTPPEQRALLAPVLDRIGSNGFSKSEIEFFMVSLATTLSQAAKLTDDARLAKITKANVMLRKFYLADACRLDAANPACVAGAGAGAPTAEAGAPTAEAGAP